MAGAENTVTLRIAAEDAYSAVMDQAVQAFMLLGKEAVADIVKIQGAFQTLNLKSSLNIDVEKAKLLDAFNAIKTSGVASADDIKRAQVAYHAELEKLDQQLKIVRKSSGDADDAHQKLGGTFVDLKGMVTGLIAGLSAFSLADMVKQSVEAAVKMQAIDVQFKTISGSSALAAQNIKFVSDESNRLGLVFVDTADAFAKFSASAKGTAIEGQGVKNVFTGVTEAVTALHLPADAAQRIFWQLSQMMSKGKVTAEDLNVVAESMPGTYTALAKSLGMTTGELQKQMQAGTLLASDVLPKLGAQLHETYGSAAVEGAKSAQAEFNRFKNGIFELSASFGQTLMPVVKLAMNVLTGMGAVLKGVVDILGPGAPVAVAFAVAIGALSLAWKLLTAEVLVSTAAFLTNPVFLLIAAGTAAVVAVAAAINEIAKAMGLTGTASEKSAEAQAAALKATEEKAAAEKKILDDYEKAMGVSLDRQLAKEKQTYEESVKAVTAKWDADIQAANDNAAKVKTLEAAKAKDLEELYHSHLTSRQGLRDKDAEEERKYYSASLQTGSNYFKAIGDQTGEEINDYKLKLAKKIEAVEKYYAQEIDKAQGNVPAIIGFEAAKQQQITTLKEKAAEDHVLIGLNRQKRELENEKQATAAQIAEIKQQVAEHTLSVQDGQNKILQIETASAQKVYENRLAFTEQTKKTYGDQSSEYKSALKDQESAYSAYIGKAVEDTKNAEAQKKAGWELNTAVYKNILDKEIIFIQDYYSSGNLSAKEAALYKLAAETDYYEKIKKLRAEQLSVVDPQTQALEYQKALSVKIDADKRYDDSYKALLNAQEVLSADNQAKITARHKEEVDKRQVAEQVALDKQRTLSANWFDLWDNVYKSAHDSLIKLSDAAYNAYAAMTGQPLKAAESVDTFRQAASDARQEAIALGKAADLAALTAVQGFGAAYHQLNDVSATAKEVAADFYDQSAAAADLGKALEDPLNVTTDFVDASETAAKKMDLLDKTTLDKLNSQISKIKDAMLAFTDRVKESLKSLQDEWNSMTMSKLELENKRYSDAVIKNNKDMAEAVRTGNIEAQKAARETQDLLTKIHDKKVEEINAEIEAEKKATTARNTEAEKQVTNASTANTKEAESFKTMTDSKLSAETTLSGKLTEIRNNNVAAEKAAADEKARIAKEVADKQIAENERAIEAMKQANQVVGSGGGSGSKSPGINADGSYSLSGSAADARNLQLLNERVTNALRAGKLADINKATDDLKKYRLTGVLPFAEGGIVPGSGNGDTVPAMLTPGEGILTKSVVQILGPGFVDDLNNFFSGSGSSGRFSLPAPSFLAFANGGVVPEISSRENKSISGSSFVVNLHLQRLDETTVRREVIPVLEKFAKMRL